MPVLLHDTMSRELRPLLPRRPDGVYGMYCCGPTVYGPAHIGNFRTFVLQDTLRRVLEAEGIRVRHVRNLTDVDDKTIRGAQAAGKSLADFTRGWTEKFHRDCAALNLLSPHVEPSAVAHIPQQVRMIEALVARGHAYVARDGSVYFKVCTCPDYGKLSHLDRSRLASQDTNSAGEANDADEYDRESAADFALWKARKPEDGDNHWPSPWGEGRPGWHIECSAMSLEHLGATFDLHAGGVDLCFPHHENEIAQSECATGIKGFAAHWFHSAHLMVEGQKMSKSLGNLFTLDDLAARGWSPMEVRWALLAGHYRSPLNFTFKGLDDARSALAKLERGCDALLAAAGFTRAEFAPPTAHEPRVSWGRLEPAWNRLRDDLNVPGALGEVFKTLAHPPADREEARRDVAGLARVLLALGIIPFAPRPALEAPAEVRSLADRRWAAKQSRDFAAADALRAEIAGLGWEMLDRKDGFDLKPR
jgi:cysteinyl-tRNA synthetase